MRRRERRVRHSTRALEPTSSTVPAATENDHQNDDDDQKRRGVHHCLLFEAQRIGVPPREGEFHCEGSDPAACLGLRLVHNRTASRGHPKGLGDLNPVEHMVSGHQQSTFRRSPEDLRLGQIELRLLNRPLSFGLRSGRKGFSYAPQRMAIQDVPLK